MDLAHGGATTGGGVHRLVLTDLDIEVHCLMNEWALERGFSVGLDAIGDRFVEFFIDFRHPSSKTLPELVDAISIIAKENEGPSVAIVRDISSAAPEPFANEIINKVAAATVRHNPQLRKSTHDLLRGAGRSTNVVNGVRGGNAMDWNALIGIASQNSREVYRKIWNI